MGRYFRQELFSGIGKEGQKRLAQSYVILVGCGALGTVSSSILARAGIGRLRIIDRDFIELNNLHRQILYNENDVRENIPKAVAAERHLRQINSTIEIEGIVTDLNCSNAESLLKEADLIVDGLDNIETRLLVNDVALKNKMPWIYGGAIGSSGMTMNVIGGNSPCLRCVMPEIPDPGLMPTCDTAGVIAPAPFMVASFQATEAIKILVGKESSDCELLTIDVWEGRFGRHKVSYRTGCSACGGRYEFLAGKLGTRSVVLCGQNSVQVIDGKNCKVSFDALELRLNSIGKISRSEFMLRLEIDPYEMVIFPDGRTIIKNTVDEVVARGLYSKYIGM